MTKRVVRASFLLSSIYLPLFLVFALISSIHDWMMKYYFDQLTFERMVVKRLISSQPSKSKKIELSLKFDLKILFSDNVGLPSFKALLLLIQLERTKKLKLLLSSLLMLRIVLSFSFSLSLSPAQCLSRFLSLSHVPSPTWFLSSQGSFF